MLGQSDATVVLGEDGVVQGVRAGGQLARCRAVVGDPSYFPQQVTQTGRVRRALCILVRAFALLSRLPYLSLSLERGPIGWREFINRGLCPCGSWGAPRAGQPGWLCGHMLASPLLPLEGTLWFTQLTSRPTDERRIIRSPTPTTRSHVKSFYRRSSWAAAPTSTSSVCLMLITQPHPAGACTHTCMRDGQRIMHHRRYLCLYGVCVCARDTSKKYPSP
jgi:hypothetical protein